MEDGNLAILVDAKTEYTKQLVNILSPYIYNGIKQIYVEAKEECFEQDLMENTLRIFQKRLSDIPKWNQEIIDQEYENVIIGSKCDWLEDLIMAVFVSHTRILTSINFSKSKNKVNLKIPKVDHFIHQCYIEVARCFWKNPYLFDDSINKYEFQRNRREAEKLIESQIHETIRRQLPVKNILREYLGNEYREVEDGEEEIENDTNYNDNLRKLVKAEIENVSKEKLDQFTIDNEDSGENAQSLENSESEVNEENSSDTLNEAGDQEQTTNEENLSNTLNEDGDQIQTTNEEKSSEKSSKDEPTVEANESNESNEDNETNEANEANEAKESNEANEANEMKESNETIDEVKPVINNEPSEDALSDNEIENKEVANIIESEVEKLALGPIDLGLKVEELNFDFDDLSELEEVYQDSTRVNSPIKSPSPDIDSQMSELDLGLSDVSSKPNLKLEVAPAFEQASNTPSELNPEPAIKTIIIDTKKGANKVMNDDNNLEINEFEDDEGSDSDIESDALKQKVYNRYSKKRDYSFFK